MTDGDIFIDQDYKSSTVTELYKCSFMLILGKAWAPVGALYFSCP